MSGGGFHVHGPHDHAVEHVGHGDDRFSGRIAVLTALLATVGAMFGYQAGTTQNDAALFKNNAAIHTTKASDQWNYYQAKSNKQNLAELGSQLPGADTAKYKADVARYGSEKEQIKAAAQKLEAQADAWDHKSELAMHAHHQWALATTAEQIAIALAAITLLTRRRWLQYATYGVAVLGTGLGVCAWLHVDPLGALLLALGAAGAAH